MMHASPLGIHRKLILSWSRKKKKKTQKALAEFILPASTYPQNFYHKTKIFFI